MYRKYNFKGQTLLTRTQATKLSQNKQSHLKMIWELFLGFLVTYWWWPGG